MPEKMPSNPYGGGPGVGISLPDYYKPTKYISNNNFYFPGTETLGADEMRVSFVGSTPWPPRIKQAGTAIMVELGNGDNFFFDLGNGSIKNILAMGVPPVMINDIFISHLHVDHYADLPYMIPFTASAGRWDPLRVYGPDGARPDLGTAAMIDNMKKMLGWHFEEFDFMPTGDGYQIDVTEFDHRDEMGVIYDKNGVTVRHWPRSHGKDGASAYRLDWEETGLSFVWTGDGRPDELTIKYSEGVDVFVSEVQSDLGYIASLKYGYPQEIYNYVIDTHHTTHYALGYLFNEIQPRVGLATHIEYEPGTNNEVVAGVRAHYDGLFLFGAPDVQVINVTKDAVWSREAVLPEFGTVSRPTPEQLKKAWFPDGEIPEFLEIDPCKLPREEQQDPYLREIEIDPALYTPPDVMRELVTRLPPTLKIPVGEMLDSQGDE
ncbi:MAG: MBL fold metallo-hydrolase [Actinomycetia bacterium]|nr:MBL fold metallo-hydrolase [Actinomycetes bacterium]